MQEWNFFTVVQQLVVVLTIIAQLVVAFNMLSSSRGGEQLVRGLALSTGVLVFLGSYVLKVTFADILFLAITDASLFQIIVAGTVMPILVGIVVSELAITVLSSGGDRSIRMMLLGGVFITTQIAYLNYMAISQTTIPYEKALLPNLCYAVAMGFWAVIRYESSVQSQYSRY